MSEGDKSARRFNNKVIIGFVLLFVGLALAAGFFGWQFFTQKKDPEKARQDMATRITEEVGRIYALPTDEKPTVAQVQDKSKLADQQFFDKAKNGDYVIIYQTAKLALLYRESAKKLINVGPISIDNQQAQATGQSSSVQGEKTVKSSGQEGRSSSSTQSSVPEKTTITTTPKKSTGDKKE